MDVFQRVDRSVGLASGLAYRQGVDFSDRIMRKPTAGTEKFHYRVMQITACKNPGDCEKLPAGCGTLGVGPDY